MSRRVSSSKKVSEARVCCKHCKNTGEDARVCKSHNTLDARGRVCCPKILSNVCSKCNNVGHLPSRCVVTKSVTDVLRRMSFVPETRKVAPVSAVARSTKVSCGGFDAFMESDSSPDQSPRTPRSQSVKAKPEPSAPVKAKPQLKASQMDWAIESDDEEEQVALPVTLSANVTVRTKAKRDWADYESDEDW